MDVYVPMGKEWMMMSFFMCCCLQILVLLWCLRLFDKAQHGSPVEKKLKAVVWLAAASLTDIFFYREVTIVSVFSKVVILASSLTLVLFYYEVTALMPTAFKVVVWAMALLTTIGDASAWFQYFGWGSFLTFSPATAVYRSMDEPWPLSFVVFAYVNILLLFFCLSKFEKAPPNSPKKKKMKLMVWLLAVSISDIYNYESAANIMSVTMKVVVCAMASSQLLVD